MARGRELATTGAIGTPACATCHGADLRGVTDVPPIAGRSPIYLLRQLAAFRPGARSSPASAQMVPAVAAPAPDASGGTSAARRAIRSSASSTRCVVRR
ncbi:MAG: c-type cytochrome [Pseudomonadota bacterium]